MKGRILSQGLLVALLCAAAIYLSGCNTADSVTIGGDGVAYDEVLGGDSNGDGTDDRKSYYKDAKLVLTAFDANGDGKDDLWLKYDDELYLTMEMYDTNGDGEPDKFIHLTRDEEVIKIENRK